MSDVTTPRVAVIGAGAAGRGWATVAVAQGWTVTLFDPTTATAEDARAEVNERVRRMQRIGLALEGDAKAGLDRFQAGRSLLQAVTDADWIIDAGSEELAHRQRSLEQVEQVGRLAAVITSSSRLHHASELCARLRRPERLLCVVPPSPMEFLPVVEVVPGPLTDPGCVEAVRFWLRRLGRVPIVLHREVPGNVSGRIAAAVWRECVELVLEGVVSVEDLDRALTANLAVAWTAAGPLLDTSLQAGSRDLNLHLSELLGAYESWWTSLSRRERLDADAQHHLVRALERAYQAQLPTLRVERDQRLAAHSPNPRKP